MGSRIYVGNLNEDASKHDLERLFETYGPLRDVWVARNPPGFAFIVFEDNRDADDAVRDLDGHKIYGVRIRVEHARGPTRGGRAARLGLTERCYECGRVGHFARDCTRRPGYQYRGNGSQSRSRSRSPRRRRSRSRSRSPKRRSYSPSPKRTRRSRSPRERSSRRDKSHSRDKSRDRSAEREKSRSHSRSVSVEKDEKNDKGRDRSASPDNRERSPDKNNVEHASPEKIATTTDDRHDNDED